MDLTHFGLKIEEPTVESKIVVKNTPVELHYVGKIPVYVKREDLSAPSPGPKFSKIRGVEAHLRKRKEDTIGVLDTYHSKAGWGVSYICQQLNKQAVVFYPHYKGEPELREQQVNAQNMGAKLISLPAGRSSILYHAAKKKLMEIDPSAYMMPNALKLSESINETAVEVKNCPEFLFKNATWVVSVSSGTLAAGVLKGLMHIPQVENLKFIMHMGYSRSQSELFRYVWKMAGVNEPIKNIEVSYIDEGFDYKDSVLTPEPSFPCNEYYDRKAWRWLHNNAEKLVERSALPIMFWNIGE